MLLSIMTIVFSAVIALLYIYKIFILSMLAWKSGKPVPVSFESRYKYILHRLFLAGYPLKTKTMTPSEYGEINKGFCRFAALFTELLYREVYSGIEYEELIENFRIEYEKLYNLTSPAGIKSALKAVFSLRGVFY